MLKESDAIRIEYETVTSKKGPYTRPVLIFPCLKCGKEMRKQKGSLTRHTGYCVRCVKRSAHPLQTVYNGMKSSCLRENIRSGRHCPFELTFEEFLPYTEIRMCAYCAGTVNWNEYSAGPSNLDRKDSSHGYVEGNVIVCCGKCNRMKSNYYSFDEFVVISCLLREWRSGRSAPRDLL